MIHFSLLSNLAKNREEWNNTEEAFAQQWTQNKLSKEKKITTQCIVSCTKLLYRLHNG